MSESLTDKPVDIYRAFPARDSDQTVGTHNGGTWRISDLKAVAAEEGLVPFDLPLQFINLSVQKFDCEDLYDFLQHVRMIESVDMNEPIILNHRGQILDGRHRICRAILDGKTTIKAIKFLRDVAPSKY